MNWNDTLARAVIALGPAWLEQLLEQSKRLGVSPQTVAQRVFRLGLARLQSQERLRVKRLAGRRKGTYP